MWSDPWAGAGLLVVLGANSFFTVPQVGMLEPKYGLRTSLCRWSHAAPSSKAMGQKAQRIGSERTFPKCRTKPSSAFESGNVDVGGDCLLMCQNCLSSNGVDCGPFRIEMQDGFLCDDFLNPAYVQRLLFWLWQSFDFSLGGFTNLRFVVIAYFLFFLATEFISDSLNQRIQHVGVSLKEF